MDHNTTSNSLNDPSPHSQRMGRTGGNPRGRGGYQERPKKRRKGVADFFKRFDLFPDVYASRISFGDGRTNRQTLTGACCTLFFLMAAATLIISYIYVVHEDENTTFTSASLPYNTNEEMRVGKDFVFAFTIDDAHTPGQALDPTKLTIAGLKTV